jgi:hypothetical protein
MTGRIVERTEILFTDLHMLYSTQLLYTNRSLIIVMGKLLDCTLEDVLQDPITDYRVTGFMLGGYGVHILGGCIQISLKGIGHL